MKLPKLTNLSVTGTTVGDVHFPKVKLLLPFGGSNGVASTSDSSNSNTSISFQGSSTISTAQSKFGSSSLYVPTSDPAGIYFGGAGTTIQLTGDFAFEWWFYRVQVSLTNGQTFGPIYGTSNYSNPSAGSHAGLLIANHYDGAASLYASDSGSGWNLVSDGNLTTAALGTVGQWVHMALTRSGTTWNYYVDGTRTYTASLGSSTIATPGSYITLGNAWGSSSNAEGYYDDFRITQGLARYTGASFTPPTTAHLTSAGDVNKQIVVNSDADGVAVGTGGISQARIAKAWVNLDSTQAAASMIRESYNVSSMTDTATGRYTINFSTALSNANFCFAGSAGNNAGTTTNGRDVTNDGTRTTSALPIRVTRDNDVAVEDSYVGVIVFGN